MREDNLRTARSVLRDSNYYPSTSPDIHNYPLRFVYAFRVRVGGVTSYWAYSNPCEKIAGMVVIGTLLALDSSPLSVCRNMPQPSTWLQRNLNKCTLKRSDAATLRGQKLPPSLASDCRHKLRAKMVTPLHIPPNRFVPLFPTFGPWMVTRAKEVGHCFWTAVVDMF